MRRQPFILASAAVRLAGLDQRRAALRDMAAVPWARTRPVVAAQERQAPHALSRRASIAGGANSAIWDDHEAFVGEMSLMVRHLSCWTKHGIVEPHLVRTVGVAISQRVKVSTFGARSLPTGC
jgi:hypothetical protein